MKCMNGHIISGTSISVDYWLWTPGKKLLRFLSHLHADHTYKLNSTFRENIFTSKFNAWLAHRWFNIPLDLLTVLDVGSSIVMHDENTETFFTVTLIDANHCPGSVMFLFQGSFGCILYTGDFRYSPSMLEHPMVKSVVENEVLSRLYLDNTFAAEHCEFPTRKEALNEVISLIRSHPDHHILIGLRKLGKEEVIQQIALDLKEMVLVTKEKLEILKYMQYKNVFTTDPSKSRILVKDMHLITSKFIQQLKEEKGPVLTILLTALYSALPPGEKFTKKQEDKELGIHRIPYSDHSCHSELLEFVSRLKPETIHPIVKVSVPNIKNVASERNKDSLNSLALNITLCNSIIPESILKFCRKPLGGGEFGEEEKSFFVEEVPAEMETSSCLLTEDESRNALNGCIPIVGVNNGFHADVQNSAKVNKLQEVNKKVEEEEWFSLSDEDFTQKSVVHVSKDLPGVQNKVNEALSSNSTSLITDNGNLNHLIELLAESNNSALTKNEGKKDAATQTHHDSYSENRGSVMSVRSKYLKHCTSKTSKKRLYQECTSGPVPTKYISNELLAVSKTRNKGCVEKDSAGEFYNNNRTYHLAGRLPNQKEESSPDSAEQSCLPKNKSTCLESSKQVKPTNLTPDKKKILKRKILFNTPPLRKTKISNKTQIATPMAAPMVCSDEDNSEGINKSHKRYWSSESSLSSSETDIDEEVYSNGKVKATIRNKTVTKYKDNISSSNNFKSFVQKPQYPSISRCTDTNKDEINNSKRKESPTNSSNGSTFFPGVLSIPPKNNHSASKCQQIKVLGSEEKGNIKSGKKKFCISEHFKDLLVTSLRCSESDSFLEAISSSRFKRTHVPSPSNKLGVESIRPDLAHQLDPSTADTMYSKSGSFTEQCEDRHKKSFLLLRDKTDILLTNIGTVYSNWKRSVKNLTCTYNSTSNMEAHNFSREPQEIFWKDFGWKHIFEKEK